MAGIKRRAIETLRYSARQTQGNQFCQTSAMSGYNCREVTANPASMQTLKHCPTIVRK
jgi:hypothetical protein